jgi:hypothetical protein
MPVTFDFDDNSGWKAGNGINGGTQLFRINYGDGIDYGVPGVPVQDEKFIWWEEEGANLRFSGFDEGADPRGVLQLRLTELNGISNFLRAQTSNTRGGQDEFTDPNDPDLDVPQDDVYTLQLADDSGAIDAAGRFVSTADDPIVMTFARGLGEWSIKFHKEDGTFEEVIVGDDDRSTLPGFEEYLADWANETATAPPGEYTKITFEPLTPQLVPNKSQDFQLTSISMDSYFCFLEGTNIETAHGPVPVEELKEGDLLVTADGRTTPVIWVGFQHVASPFVAKDVANPIRISANAIAKGVPSRDLYVSPDHGIFIDGLLYNAITLVNGTTIQQVDRLRKTGFTYYNIEVEAHELILAEGCPAETYVDIANRDGFDNFDDYTARFGASRVIEEMNIPRVSTARLVPHSLKVALGLVEDKAETETGTPEQLTSAA